MGFLIHDGSVIPSLVNKTLTNLVMSKPLPKLDGMHIPRTAGISNHTFLKWAEFGVCIVQPFDYLF